MTSRDRRRDGTAADVTLPTRTGSSSTAVAVAPPDAAGLREALAAARKRWAEVAAAILAEAGVEAIEYRASLSGTAWVAEKRVRIPPPTSRRRLYIVAHEAAHVALGHRGDRPSHRQECEAERYAHDALRRHGIAVPRKSTVSAKQYVARRIRTGRSLWRQANRPRGVHVGARLPPGRRPRGDRVGAGAARVPRSGPRPEQVAGRA